jgi:hypothetical protein
VFAEHGLGEVEGCLRGIEAALIDDRAKAAQKLQIDIVNLAQTSHGRRLLL